MIDLVEQIGKAIDFEIGELLKAVLKRYAVLFPDWEVCTFSVQKSEDKNQQIDRMIEMLQKFKSVT